MGRFTIGILGRDSNPHARCFEDVARALSHALKELGHEVMPFGSEEGRYILFATNNVSDPYDKMPRDAIIFNSEQVAADHDTTRQIQGLDVFKKHQRVIWDYSSANIAALKKAGAERVVHCPIGYSKVMVTSAKNDAPKDIDVLFYGSTNARRLEILNALDKTDLKVARLFNVYGDELDSYIQRSKVVLNIHFFDRAIFEIFRVSHLLANIACVVSEDGGQDEELEQFAREACVVVPREMIVATCLRYARNTDLRTMQAVGGHMRFSLTDFTKNVKLALEQS